MIQFKKCITPVIAITLLLLVSISSIVMFQSWFQTSGNKMFTNIANTNSINIENVYDNKLYIKNDIQNNLTLTSLKIGGNVCNVSINLNLGINNIDISSCLTNLSGPIQDVVLISNKFIVVRNLYFLSLAGGGGSCSIYDIDNDGILSWLDNNDTTFNSICDSGISGFCFLNETNKSTLEVDLSPSNIKSGISIFGVTGNLTIINTSPCPSTINGFGCSGGSNLVIMNGLSSKTECEKICGFTPGATCASWDSGFPGCVCSSGSVTPSIYAASNCID